MNDTSKVALLVDFENLVFGLEAMHGEDYAQHVEPEVLIRLAEEYGQVVLANAYADWRSRDANQFQTDLYRLGIDLVHVFAKRQQGRIKNAVDVKMGVDAVETVWTLPHIETFVIVSGDRDFIHVLKARLPPRSTRRLQLRPHATMSPPRTLPAHSSGRRTCRPTVSNPIPTSAAVCCRCCSMR